MACYNLKIETEGEETINFSPEVNTEDNKEVITNFEFKMNTLNDETLNRSGSVRCEMVIKGLINKATKNESLKLAKWAKIRGGESKLYRKVRVEVFTDNGRGDLLREYEVDKMFCIDYTESFKDSSDNGETGEFELYIAQKEGTYTTDVFCE